MMACIGMSTTMHGYIRGQVKDTHLAWSTLYFSCGRGHLFGQGVPCEATALNTELPIRYRGQCSLRDVDPAHRRLVNRFLRLVEQADGQPGRVFWNAGNQRAIVESLPDGVLYFWRKGWAVATMSVG